MQAVVGLFLFSVLLTTDPAAAIQVTIQNPFNVVSLFQPVTFKCTYQTTGTQPPVVIWKYKSYCYGHLANDFNLSSLENHINLLQQKNCSYYNPLVDCPDNNRTVRAVASKQGNKVALGEFYHGRNITITNDADLSIEQSALGDSGVYYCAVISPQDLQGNNEAYAELIVLGTSLACETCVALGDSCSSQKQKCPADLDTCLTAVFEGTAGYTGTTTVKTCYSRAACDLLKTGATVNFSGVSATIKEVTCKAPPPLSISPAGSLRTSDAESPLLTHLPEDLTEPS